MRERERIGALIGPLLIRRLQFVPPLRGSENDEISVRLGSV